MYWEEKLPFFSIYVVQSWGFFWLTLVFNASRSALGLAWGLCRRGFFGKITDCVHYFPLPLGNTKLTFFNLLSLHSNALGQSLVSLLEELDDATDRDLLQKPLISCFEAPASISVELHHLEKILKTIALQRESSLWALFNSLDVYCSSITCLNVSFDHSKMQSWHLNEDKKMKLSSQRTSLAVYLFQLCWVPSIVSDQSIPSTSNGRCRVSQKYIGGGRQ